jgi:putative sigma-54 modulation protein
MNVQIQTVHFDADSKLIDHVKAKLEKLKTFHDKILSVEVYLKLDSLAHHIKDKKVEIKVQVPKHMFFVEYESKAFEESLEHAMDALINQIKRHKEKQMA